LSKHEIVDGLLASGTKKEIMCLPSLDDFRNFLLDNEVSGIIQEYSSIVV